MRRSSGVGRRLRRAAGRPRRGGRLLGPDPDVSTETGSTRTGSTPSFSTPTAAAPTSAVQTPSSPPTTARRGPEPAAAPRRAPPAGGASRRPHRTGPGAAGHGADRLRPVRRPDRVRARRAGRRVLGQLRGRGGAGRLGRAGDGARRSAAAGAAEPPGLHRRRAGHLRRAGRGAAAVGVRVPSCSRSCSPAASRDTRRSGSACAPGCRSGSSVVAEGGRGSCWSWRTAGPDAEERMAESEGGDPSAGSTSSAPSAGPCPPRTRHGVLALRHPAAAPAGRRPA